MWWMIAFSLVGCVALLYLDGRRNEAAVWRDWELLLTPKGATAYRQIEERVQDDLAVADVTLKRALEAHKLGSTNEALELLDAGYLMIEGFAPNMSTLLASLSAFSRMVAAMAPLPPLRPRDFRLAKLSRLAYLNGALHHFLVSTAERFRLRVYVLRKGFQIAAHYLLHSRKRLAEQPAGEAGWAGVQDAHRDLHVLSNESLESFKTLLLSLTAVPRGQLAYQVPDQWGM
jgi:hypothetical protein